MRHTGTRNQDALRRWELGLVYADTSHAAVAFPHDFVSQGLYDQPHNVKCGPARGPYLSLVCRSHVFRARTSSLPGKVFSASRCGSLSLRWSLMKKLELLSHLLDLAPHATRLSERLGHDGRRRRRREQVDAAIAAWIGKTHDGDEEKAFRFLKRATNVRGLDRRSFDPPQFQEAPHWIETMAALLHRAYGPEYGSREGGPIGELGMGVLLNRFEAALSEGLIATVLRFHHLAWSKSAISAACVWLETRWEAVLAPVLRLEYTLKRNASKLDGVSSNLSFSAFLESSGQTLEWWLWFFELYPAALRLMGESVKFWYSAIDEMAVRLDTDLPILRNAGMALEGALLVTGFQPGAGDSHQNGRTVSIVSVGHKRIVYKPRDGRVTAWFRAALEQATGEAHGPKVFVREGYCWEEFVSTAEEDLKGDEAGLVEECGFYAAMLQATCGSDFHEDNVMVAGKRLLLLDLECLFECKARPPKWYTASEAALYQRAPPLADASYLLPSWSIGMDGSVKGLRGGLSWGGRVQTYHPLPSVLYKEGHGFVRTMNLALVQKRRTLPYSNGMEWEFASHESRFSVGYERALSLLRSSRARLLRDGLFGRTLASLPVRFVPRRTQVYAQLLAESYEPESMVDMTVRELQLAKLYRACTSSADPLVALVAAEVDALSLGDVPYFTICAGSRVIRTSGGRSIRGIVLQSGLSRSRQSASRLAANSAPYIAEAKTQLWTSSAAAFGRPPLQLIVLPKPEARTRKLERVAEELAQEILKAATQTGRSAPAWTGLSWTSSDSAPTINALPADLLSGWVGLAVLLAEGSSLGLLRGGGPPARQLMERLLSIAKTSPGLCNRRSLVPAAASRTTAGLQGAGAFAYGLAAGAHLLGMPHGHRAARAILRHVAAARERGGSMDWANGLSGFAAISADLLDPRRDEGSIRALVEELSASDHLGTDRGRTTPSGLETRLPSSIAGLGLVLERTSCSDANVRRRLEEALVAELPSSQGNVMAGLTMRRMPSTRSAALVRALEMRQESPSTAQDLIDCIEVFTLAHRETNAPEWRAAAKGAGQRLAALPERTFNTPMANHAKLCYSACFGLGGVVRALWMASGHVTNSMRLLEQPHRP
jgi:lantibiotic modifying enzyme